MSESSLSSRLIRPAIVSLIVAVFVLDILTPWGWAVWLLYILPLLIAFRFNRIGYLVPIAAAATVLIALHFYHFPPGFPVEAALINWTLGTTVLWGLTLLLVQRGRIEATLAASKAHLRAIIESEPECVKLLDRDGRLLDMNPAGLAMIEADSLDQVRGYRLCALVEESQRPAFEALNEAVFRGESGALTFETVGLKGGRRWLEIHAVPLRDQAGHITSMLAITRDITERKQTEAKLLRANRALKAIGKCNAALATSTDEALFTDKFCRILVEDAGYRLAWVGLAEPGEAMTVRPVAQAGFESGYLDRARISWANDECGRDPTGTVIRTGRPCVNQDVLTNPAYEPWRAEALKRGYASYAALPLARAGRTIGVLNLYAAEPNAFDEREMALLMELANDLAHGLEFLRMRAERKRAEEALRRNETLLGIFIEYAPAALAMFDCEMRYLYVSRRWLSDYGLGEGDLHGRSHYEVFPEIPEVWKEAHRRGLAGEVLRAEADRFERADGSLQWVRWEIRPWFDSAGSVGGIVIFTEDITERKHAEEELRISREELRMLAGRLQETQEAERKRIAREIHDELGQTLTAMKLDLGWTRRLLQAEGGPAPQAEALEKIRSLTGLVDGAMDSVRRVAAALRPRVLDDLGLAAALEWQANEFQARTGIRCELHISPAIVAAQIDPAYATALFRIAQELLTNTARHAQALKVGIALTQEEGKLVLEVHDDGKGISEEEIQKSPSLGLLGVRERATLLGGEYAIHGEPGKGTTVVVKLPIPTAKMVAG